MKLLKITVMVFVATLCFSAIKSRAATVNFIGMTINVSDNPYPYLSSQIQKETTASQSFYLSSCKDKIIWSDRNLKISIQDNVGNHPDWWKELSGGESYTFTQNFTTQMNKFRIILRIANTLIPSVYLNATWYVN